MGQEGEREMTGREREVNEERDGKEGEVVGRARERRGMKEDFDLRDYDKTVPINHSFHIYR